MRGLVKFKQGIRIMIRYVQRMLRRRKVNNTTRRLVADRSGSALVEFAFVIAPTLALVFGIIQTMLLFFVSQIVETATERAGRLLLTNQIQSATIAKPYKDTCGDTFPTAGSPTITQANFRTIVRCQLPSFMQSSDNKNIQVNIQTYTGLASVVNTNLKPALTYDANGNSTSTAYNPGGNSGGIVAVLQVYYYWPVLNAPLNFTLDNTGNGNHLIFATSVFQTEP